MHENTTRTGWRTVKVFLSSTFRDMHAERDHLIKVTFPAPREKLLPYLSWPCGCCAKLALIWLR